MVSRKKAAAKARKAAKEAKAKAREKAREEQAKERVADQLLLQPCKHGVDPLSLKRNSIVFQFVRAFAKKIDDEFRDKSNIAKCLVSAHNATLNEFADVWNDSAKMEKAMSFFLFIGTQQYLEGEYANARMAATYARYFEQYIATELKQTQAIVNWPKILEAQHADDHTLVKFFRHRIPCSCLDEKYDEVKSITKMGFCYNAECKFYCVKGEGVERRITKYCSRCRCETYCSRECQEADWSEHKPLCDKGAVLKAKFEAKQWNIQA